MRLGISICCQITRKTRLLFSQNRKFRLVTTLIFLVVGIIAVLCTRICCNRGPSANLWAIVDLAQLKPLIVPILNESE